MDLVERGIRAEGEALMRKQKDRAWRVVRAHTGVVNLMLVLDEFCSAAKDIRNSAKKKGLAKSAGQTAEWEDNRLLWGRKAAMPCCSSELSLLIRWYVSIQDGTGPLERALSTLMHILERHLGGNRSASRGGVAVLGRILVLQVLRKGGGGLEELQPANTPARAASGEGLGRSLIPLPGDWRLDA